MSQRRRRAGPSHLTACPHCGRQVLIGPSGGIPSHYSPSNPPVLGAWHGCPGPTERERLTAELRASATAAPAHRRRPGWLR